MLHKTALVLKGETTQLLRKMWPRLNRNRYLEVFDCGRLFSETTLPSAVIQVEPEVAAT